MISLTEDTVNGFIEVQFNQQISASGTKSIFQIMQEVAEVQKIKAISVSYEAVLNQLDPTIDQFFHVYPFGVLEAFVNPFTPHNLESRFKVNIDPIDKLKWFNKLDSSKDFLMVDAKGALLPQFTFLSPYSSFDFSNDARSDRNRSTNDNLLMHMAIEASGIQNRLGNGLNQYSGEIQEEGLLYIGLENLKPLQIVTLLFQFAEGSAEDEDNDPPEIHWSYLSNNEWKPFNETNIISDGTFGFQTTGILKIEVPADITNNNTIVTNGLYWLRASVSENAHRIPKLVDVVAQAVVARFNDQDNDPTHFNDALPAESISKLITGQQEIKTVFQPFASWDGEAKEIGRDFYMGVSERLRHKERAINAWDYEHLILDRFPGIYKVKCITHTDPNCLCRESETSTNANREVESVCCGPQVAPGHVMVVPIANFKNRNSTDPLQPKTSRRTLIEITEYLKKRTSPFVHIHARNPVYEEVIILFRVKFHIGIDKGYYLKKLNEEIVRYLTPWAFDENAEVKFGQKIYASSVINFIEEQSYVDFIKDFFMGLCKDDCCAKQENIIAREDTVESLPPTDIPIVKGKIVNGSTGEAIVGANVVIEGTTTGTITDIDGNFTLTMSTNQTSLSISMAGFRTKLKLVNAHTNWLIYMYEVTDVVTVESEDEDLEQIFSRFCGCDSVENELENNADFPGSTVLTPSTSRSLLVSVPEHIIIACEEEVTPDPCEIRKQNISGEGIPERENIMTRLDKVKPFLSPQDKAKIVKKAAVSETEPKVKPAKSTATKRSTARKKNVQKTTPKKTTRKKPAANKSAKPGRPKK